MHLDDLTRRHRFALFPRTDAAARHEFKYFTCSRALRRAVGAVGLHVVGLQVYGQNWWLGGSTASRQHLLIAFIRLTQRRNWKSAIGDDEVDRRAESLRLLIHLWKAAGRSGQAYYAINSSALETYNTQGLYADAIRWRRRVARSGIKGRGSGGDVEILDGLSFLKLLMSHIGLEDIDTSFKLAEEVGLPMAERDASRRNQLFYLLAILYARFKKPRDLQKGEEYLELSLAAIAESDMPEGERHFRYVFNRNGLAMIRNFQRRPQEAIELCRTGFAYLNEHLGADEHRLHRSILLYNTAQVYAAIGMAAEALEYYSATIAQDPNYSEYHNERASVLLQLDRLEEAEADYLRAIELSPPYFEVFTNLGQCYRRMGAMAQSYIKEYSRALDLEPGHLLGRLGRAKAYEEAGQRGDAIDDYTAVLAQDPSLWEAFGNRGALLYEAGRLHEALADFDAAIKLKPSMGELHENRAVVVWNIEKSEAVPQEVN